MKIPYSRFSLRKRDSDVAQSSGSASAQPASLLSTQLALLFYVFLLFLLSYPSFSFRFVLSLSPILSTIAQSAVPNSPCVTFTVSGAESLPLGPHIFLLEPNYSENMISDDDVEKARDLDPTTATASPADREKVEPGKALEGTYGEPDSDHEEVEVMDKGHLDDVARQLVSSNSPQETPWLILSGCGIYQGWLPERRE
jgi:hypothetical protein